MSHADLTKVIESLFTTAWAARTPICYDNVAFKPPNNGYWIAVSVETGRSTKASLGTAPQLRRTRGSVNLTLYAPVNVGTAQAKSYADSVVTIFRDLQTSGTTFYEASVSTLGNTFIKQQKLQIEKYLVMITVPFVYDQII